MANDRAALTEAAQVVASGMLTLPITGTYRPPQIKEAIEDHQRGGKGSAGFQSGLGEKTLQANPRSSCYAEEGPSPREQEG